MSPFQFFSPRSFSFGRCAGESQQPHLLLSCFRWRWAASKLNTEYLTRYLPAHAFAELGSVVQFGLSSMLHKLWRSRPSGACYWERAVCVLRYRGHSSGALASPRGYRHDRARSDGDGRDWRTLYPSHADCRILPLAFVTASRTRSSVAWVGIALLTVPWNLLNALTPNALVVPRAHEVMLRALTYQATAGRVPPLLRMRLSIRGSPARSGASGQVAVGG